MKKLLITILACLICLQALMPCFAFEELSKGSKGDAVVELQNRLNELGYSVGNADGDFGGKTEKAIEMFQSDNGLTVTGMVDDDTYSKLFPASADSEAVTDNTSDTQEEMKNDNERQIETGNPKVVDVLAYSVGPAILLDNNEIYTVKYNEDSFVFSDVVSATDYGDNIIATRADGSTFVYRGNGTLLESNRYELDDDWTDMALVADGMYHAVGLKKDGTWISAGEYRNHECDVDNWKDIVALDVGYHHTVGLKSDGTVVATGDNSHKQCNVSQWSDIVAICVDGDVTLGLKSDGTVVATGDDSNNECFVGRWKNVVAIQNDQGHASVGLTRDGKILSTDPKREEALNSLIPDNYHTDDIIRFYCDTYDLIRGDSYVMFVKNDGIADMFGKGEYLGVAERLKHHIEHGFDPTYQISTDNSYYSAEECTTIALSYMKEHISMYLKNPSSLQINGTSCVNGDGTTYWITIDYSAMNSFGGYDRENYYCQVDYMTGEVLAGGTIG